jgi:hypothetical protein
MIASAGLPPAGDEPPIVYDGQPDIVMAALGLSAEVAADEQAT